MIKNTKLYQVDVEKMPEVWLWVSIVIMQFCFEILFDEFVRYVGWYAKCVGVEWYFDLKLKLENENQMGYGCEVMV